MRRCLTIAYALLFAACNPEQKASVQAPPTAGITTPIAPENPAKPKRLLLRPSFESYKAAQVPFTGRGASINYQSHILAREYRTVITAGYQQAGANFGGHYRFISWMCGSPCTQSVLIDLLNGKVYEGPIAGLGFDFRADSRLLLLNPPPDSVPLKIDCCAPEQRVWNETAKKFEQTPVDSFR
jgi:hypothetical protein